MDKFNFKKDILSKIKIIVLALILSIGISTVSAQWSDPNSAPPGGGPALPLHTGILGQIKEGGLTVGASVAPSGIGLAVAQGRTGISTITPTANLHVVGTARFESLPSAASNATRIIFSDTSGNLGYRAPKVSTLAWNNNNSNFYVECNGGGGSGCGTGTKEKTLGSATDWDYCSISAEQSGGFNSTCRILKDNNNGDWILRASDPNPETKDIYENNTQRCGAICMKF